MRGVQVEENDATETENAVEKARPGWGWKRFKKYWWDVFFGPYDVLNWKIFQTFFGIAWLNWFAGYIPTMEYWVSDGGFHISQKYASGHYPIPAPLIPSEWVMVFTVIYVACILLYIFDVWRNVLVWVMFWGAVYTQAVDQPSAFTLSKLFIVYFFLIGIAPQPERREGASDDEPLVMSAWPIRLLQLTLIFQYMEAGTCKTFFGDWIFRMRDGHLTFSAMDPLWGFTQGLYKNFFAAWLINFLTWKPFWVLFSLTAVGFEFFAPVLFLWRKTRYKVAIIYGICMHLGIAILMKDLIYFSLQMCAFYILWVRAEHTRMALRWMRDHLLPLSLAKKIHIKEAGGSMEL